MLIAVVVDQWIQLHRIAKQIGDGATAYLTNPDIDGPHLECSRCLSNGEIEQYGLIEKVLNSETSTIPVNAYVHPLHHMPVYCYDLKL